MMTFPLLSYLIWVPIVAGGIILFFKQETYFFAVRGFSLLISCLCLVMCGFLIKGFDAAQWQMQWTETMSWIPNLHIQYALGIDGFSLPLIVLTCFMTLFVVLASYHSVKTRVNEYLAAFLIMQGLMCGVFAALDGILFYTFWEAMLVPMFLIIGMWGGKNRIYATFKFFLYTFLGSVLLLVALIYLHFVAQGSALIQNQDVFNIIAFQKLTLSLETQKWLFLAFLAAFAVKIPMWPVHTWLPDAHVEAPAGGSVILAAIMLKMGGYGLLRFILPITPDASLAFSGGMISLSLIAIVYIAFVAIVQKDMKKLIAYSSIAHMGFVTLGFFIIFALIKQSPDSNHASMGIEGGMIQMISHGLVSGALFLCVGVLYDRMHSRMIKDYGGVINSMPIFASFFILFAIANVGMPGTSGFVGEFMVILAAFQANFVYAALAATILILGASYTLWMTKRVVFGPIQNESVAALVDVHGMEKLMFFLLAIAVLCLGIWPEPVLNLMHATSNHLLDQVSQSKIVGNL